MKLRYLRLENYRSFARVELEFPAGLTAVVGPNGAGKSTLFEAAAWAFFGTSRTRAEDIKSHFAPEKSPCLVEAAVEIQGIAYRVTRELRGRSLAVHARLTREGADLPIAEGATAVGDEIQRLLGMDRTTFFASVFSRQKQVDALTEITPGKREEAFRRMLGLDSLDAVVALVRADARGLEAELRGLAAGRRDPAELEARRDKCRAALQGLKPRLERLRRAVKAAEDDEAAARKEFDRLHALEQAHSRLETDKARLEEGASKLAHAVERLRAELEAARAAGDRLEKLSPVLRELERVRARRKELDPLHEKHLRRENLKERKGEIVKALEAQKEELEALARRLEPLEGARRRAEELARAAEAARKAHAAAQKEAARAAAEAKALGRKLEELGDRAAELKKLGKKGKCPVCLQKLGESYEEALRHLGKERDEAAAACKEAERAAREAAGEESRLARRLEAAEKDRREEEKRLNALEKLESDRAARERAVRRDEADLERTESALRELAGLEFDPAEYERIKRREEELAPRKDEAARLEETAGRAPGLEKEIKAGEEKRRETLDRLKEIERRMADLGFDPALLRKAREELAAAGRARAERQKETADLEKKAVAGKKDLEAAEREIAEEKRLAALAAEKERRKARLVQLEEIFAAFRQHLTDRIRPTLAARAGALLARTTGGRYRRVELDDDYNVRVLDGGEMRVLQRFSGGETDLINLCLRIAISQVVAGRGAGRVNMLVLDEVFGSQDARRKEEILQALRSLSGEFQQVFVITHDEQLKDRMESVVAVNRPDGARSVAEVQGA